MTRSGEFDWISRHLAPLASEDSFGLKDDAALLAVPAGARLCITQDAILEGVHFLRSDPSETVARKALLVNISDCIAKGATPYAYSLALGMPDHWQDSDMAAFAKGLQQEQQEFGLKLTGGDTYRSPDRLNVSVTMLGLLTDGTPYVSRLGANSGDILCVSGTIGDAAIGLKVALGEIKTKHDGHFLQAYQVPLPPKGFEQVTALASASMDISDGLLGDARKLAVASDIAIDIDRAAIPLSPQTTLLVEMDANHWETVLSGGDDYQCLFALAPQKLAQARSIAAKIDVSFAEIGQITEKSSQSVSLTMDGVPVSGERESFSHF
ncbi:thiamine-phosphate kinase [Pseudahrensia aquimaris]|uniref:Thiamine-monophosphate kinase n=1 Tax=Pseudahrensia aquimaris TaxID=744461 RepID=A0ABW3FAX1_9HYPH